MRQWSHLSCHLFFVAEQKDQYYPGSLADPPLQGLPTPTILCKHDARPWTRLFHFLQRHSLAAG